MKKTNMPELSIILDLKHNKFSMMVEEERQHVKLKNASKLLLPIIKMVMFLILKEIFVKEPIRCNWDHWLKALYFMMHIMV